MSSAAVMTGALRINFKVSEASWLQRTNPEAYSSHYAASDHTDSKEVRTQILLGGQRMFQLFASDPGVDSRRRHLFNR